MTPAYQPPVTSSEAATAQKQQIGTAHLEKDGTIVMRLRMVQGPAVGDSEQRYHPDSPDYRDILAHLPGLKTGHDVPVFNDWN